MTAQGVEVGVIFQPALVAETVLNSLFQAVDGLLDLAQKRIHAGHIVEDPGVFRLYGQRPRPPLQTSPSLSQLTQCRGARYSARASSGCISSCFSATRKQRR